MYKKIFNVFIILFLLISLTGCSSKKANNINTTSYYKSENLSLNKTISPPLQEEHLEETIGSFSTNILDKSSGRQTNIELTCSILNGTIVKKGETFSFCDTVGKATPERGYQEAKIFDSNGEVAMGYGGGNCQVSSTLYNVVLQNSIFEVVERHPHAQTVEYVEKDKDAAVACGSVDFKFKNNANYDIRIDASTDGNQVVVSIIKI